MSNASRRESAPITVVSLGAFSGIICAPLLSWTVLRRVPLGRAAVFTTIGTLVGALGGELAQPLIAYTRNVPGVLVGALLGFIGGGLLARLRTAHRDTASSAEHINES